MALGSDLYLGLLFTCYSPWVEAAYGSVLKIVTLMEVGCILGCKVAMF